MHTVDNNTRADLADIAVQKFAWLSDMDIKSESLETVITDLLADIMHLCKRENIPYESAHTMAEIHFNEEVSEEENEN